MWKRWLLETQNTWRTNNAKRLNVSKLQLVDDVCQAFSNHDVFKGDNLLLPLLVSYQEEGERVAADMGGVLAEM